MSGMLRAIPHAQCCDGLDKVVGGLEPGPGLFTSGRLPHWDVVDDDSGWDHDGDSYYSGGNGSARSANTVQ